MSGRGRNRRLGCEHLEDRLVLSTVAVLPAAAQVEAASFRPSLPAVAGDHAGNTFRTARDIGSLQGPRQFSDRVDWTDRRDVYQFTLAAPAAVTARLDRLAQDADLYLFDAAGRLLALSDRAGRRDENIGRSLQPGKYFVVVNAYRLAATPYRLSLSAPPSSPEPADTAGASFATARDIGRLTGRRVLRESVGRRDTADVYRFHIDGDRRVSINLGGLSQDLDLYLYNARGGQLASSFRGGASAERILRSLPAGQYFVAVVPYGRVASRYVLTFDAAAPPSRAPVPPAPTAPPIPTPPLPIGPAPAPVVAPAPAPEPPPATEPPAAPEPLPDVPDFGSARDWNLNLVQAPEAWAQGYTGDGVVVAVVDTGVDLQHPDLVGNLWRNVAETPGDRIDNDGNGFVDDVFGWNFVDRTSVPDDTNGHGTHVAGTIAAARNGVGATGLAYNATIMPVRVLGDRGSGSTLDVAAGIRYAVDNGADVINLSLGGGYSSVIDTALQYAQQNDVFVAIAAGNDGASSPSFPAIDSGRLTNVLAVGAHNQNQRRAAFSNRVGQSGAVQVDAPGVGIYSTLPDGRYGQLSGTSMAAPHVAAVAALALSANPALTAGQLRNVLVAGADQAIAGSDSTGGIDAALTVALALAESPSSTTPAVGSGAGNAVSATALPRAAALHVETPARLARAARTAAVFSTTTQPAPAEVAAGQADAPLAIADAPLAVSATMTVPQSNAVKDSGSRIRENSGRSRYAVETAEALRPELVDLVLADGRLDSWRLL